MKGVWLPLVGGIFFGMSFYSSQQVSLREMYTKPPSEWVKPWVDSTVLWNELGMLPRPLYKDGIPPSKEALLLGKQLFFDPRLSQSGQIACVSCHHPDQNWTDNRVVSMGNELQQGKRNTPTILNISHRNFLFWDGRSNSLEEQILEPFTNPIEMNTPVDTVVARVNAIEGYRVAFRAHYQTDTIGIEDIAHAIGNYERSVVSRKSKFDYFLLGRKSLEDNELRGLHLFRTKGRCMNCHHGPLMTDDQYHNLGLTYYGRKYEDLGRYNLTNRPEDVGRFRTPSLRDVMYTGPWMHNGLFNNMRGIITMYSNGMPRPKRKEHQLDDRLFPKTSSLIQKLKLTDQEIEDIMAFLEAISAPSFRVQKPLLPK